MNHSRPAKTIHLVQIIERQCFFLAFTCHLLLFLLLSLVWITRENIEKSPGMEIPPSVQSYVYREQVNPTLQQDSSQTSVLQATTDTGSQIKAALPRVHKVNQFNAMNVSNRSEPVNLIGDKNVNVPLLTLLGKAFTAQLAYPKIAVDFHLKGLVLVGFTLHPDGSISEAQLVKTSGAGVLDDEAMRALLALSPIPNVSSYLNEPKFMVIGIMFGYKV